MSSKTLAPNPSPYFPNQFLKNQFFTKIRPLPREVPVEGKTVIVTGANTGLGLECATQLASRGVARLILAVRSLTKGEEVAADLRKRFSQVSIEVWSLEMTSYDSIVAFAARADKDLSRLDVAILNAGVGFTRFTPLPNSGHEQAIQINYTSTMLLAVLLLPILKKTKLTTGSPGRLTLSTAMLAIAAKFPNRHEVPLLPSFDKEEFFDTRDTYMCSKLLGHLFVWKLTDVVSADDVVVNLIDPGFVKGTDLHRNASAVSKVGLGVFKGLVARSLQSGGSGYIDAAFVKGKESHGCIVENRQIVPYGPFVHTTEGKEVMERLWEETLNELQFVDARGIIHSL